MPNQACAAQAHAELGPIDVWINNAGASANAEEAKGMSELERFEQIMAVDIIGTWRCCQTAVEQRRRKRTART